jgi:hypothetical protein
MKLFAIGNQEFGWDEIVIAAQLWGEWHGFVDSVRQSLACLRLETQTVRQLTATEMREAATAFRYARNLISAEDTRDWLDRWDVSHSDWMTYLRGRLLVEMAGPSASASVKDISDQEVAGVIRTHAICAGKVEEWRLKLAGRAAVAAQSTRFSGTDRSTVASRRELVTTIEAEFERQQREIASPKLIERKIADHRLDWIRFDCRYVWFSEEPVAREAALCLREDGLSLEEVAHEALAIVQRWDFYLDEIEEDVRPYFLAARRGECLGPVRMLEGFPLFAINDKQMPAPADPRIRERAEQAIIADFTRQAINDRVKWVTR